ncbi:hypothetical protein SD37_06175 [Amycolatopsis orientalis]|uniref:Uncharacterized protein n=2 Tax=Amycolatopsis orientalis TaxID=31958 RepID=A0A193CB48_AMYOR|nr:hypothetical protein SD37_06175 [Amycolatopsis orientalis]
MWIRDGSLRALENILIGYSVALDVHGIDEKPVMWPDGPFAQWVQSRFGWSMSAGWAFAIQAHAEGEEPLEVFFRLLDEYRAG